MLEAIKRNNARSDVFVADTKELIDTMRAEHKELKRQKLVGSWPCCCWGLPLPCAPVPSALSRPHPALWLGAQRMLLCHSGGVRGACSRAGQSHQRVTVCGAQEGGLQAGACA
jgi:hypothetical protein